MGKHNIIEINGKRYDAHSGAPIGHSHATTHAKPVAHLKPAVKKPTMHDVVRTSPKHAPVHKPHTSHTLMRQAVKKPTAHTKTHSKAQGQLVKHPVALKKSARQLDKKRLSHASQIATSNFIQHFAPITGHIPEVVTNPEPLFNPPVQPVHHPRPTPKKHKPQTTADLLERALQAATSHEQPLPKKVRKAHKRAGVLTAATLTVLVMSVIGTQQMTSVKLRMASSNAGFSVNMPGYQPSGFTMSGIESQPGIAATKYISNSDDRTFKIVQKQSNWDSLALRDTFVAQADKNYQTVEAGGRTIYLYGQNATWADSGIWYQVENYDALSSRQLVQLATTL